MRCRISPDRVFSPFPHQPTAVLMYMTQEVPPFHGKVVWGTTLTWDAALSSK